MLVVGTPGFQDGVQVPVASLLEVTSSFWTLPVPLLSWDELGSGVGVK